MNESDVMHSLLSLGKDKNCINDKILNDFPSGTGRM